MPGQNSPGCGDREAGSDGRALPNASSAQRIDAVVRETAPVQGLEFRRTVAVRIRSGLRFFIAMQGSLGDAGRAAQVLF